MCQNFCAKSSKWRNSSLKNYLKLQSTVLLWWFVSQCSLKVSYGHGGQAFWNWLNPKYVIHLWSGARICVVSVTSSQKQIAGIWYKREKESYSFFLPLWHLLYFLPSAAIYCNFSALCHPALELVDYRLKPPQSWYK